MEPSASFSVLVQEIERTLYERSYAWEGKCEQVFDLGEVLVRAYPGFAAALRLRFDPAQVEERLDPLIKQIESTIGRCVWVIGPLTQPSDLGERLRARDFETIMEGMGLILDDLSISIPVNPAIDIEPLCWQNVEEYVKQCTPSNDPTFHTYQREAAHRYLHLSQKEVQIFVARLDGQIAGYAVLRVEANSIANLCDAFTRPECRRRGVYLSLVAHRLAVAKDDGCTIALTRANTHTSAPILLKHGFTSVCQITVLARR